MDAKEQIDKFQEFFELNYHEELLHKASQTEESIVVDFPELAKHDLALAESLLEEPEETIKAAEYAITRFDLGHDAKINVRFRNLPDSSKIIIRDIRSKHLKKIFEFQGIVRQKTDVRPQVTSAKFECPSCGNLINVLQLDAKFKEPTNCSCGRKGKFRLLDQSLVDVQKLVLEESPEDLDGGEQPKRINVFLKQDLVSPMSEKKTNPGSKIKIVGILKEVPVNLPTGGQSTRYDLIFEANYVEPLHEEFTSLTLSKEEKEEIQKISKDPKIYEKLTKSIAPTVYGHDRIKEALLLQLFGGRRKSQDDGVVRRGDIHVLLVGDPGSGKSQLLKRVSHVAPKSRFVSGKGASGAGLCVSPESTVLLNPGGMESISRAVENNMTHPELYVEGVWKQEDVKSFKIQSLSNDLKLHSKHPSAIWKLKAPGEMVKVKLRNGMEIELTENTKLFTIEKGKTFWKKSLDIEEGDFVATPRKLLPGKIKEQYVADIISSNPVVHGAENIVRQAVTRLSEKYGSIRNASKKLGIHEGNLYYSWTNSKARGNIKLQSLKKICEETRLEWKKEVNKISLFNGKKHFLPVLLDGEILYVAGLIAGDGDIRKSGETTSVRLSSSTKEFHEAFRRVLKEKFGLKYSVTSKSSKRPEATRTHSKIIGEILNSLGIPFSPKSGKIRMSNILLKLNNKLLAAYISGLFDSDGTIFYREHGRGSHCASYHTCSKELAKQLQLALLRYSIRSRIRVKPPRKGKITRNQELYVLDITGISNIKKFSEAFTLNHPEKKEKLRKILSEHKKENTNTDVLPGIGSLVKKALQEKKLSLKKTRWHKNYSRNALKKLTARHLQKHPFLKNLAESDIYWEKVYSVKRTKPKYQYVYDLTVEDSHNFVVDGILVHNTAAVVRDEFLRGWALEAGALVLANRGLVCIDELDKMSKEDTSAMHEALEQQSVSVSKANIQATLRAETTVLAAANPKFGRFDPYELLVKQIELPSTLINRFDLIFPVKDLPDKEKDDQLASFILELHKEADQAKSDIDTDVMKKYVAYAKQFVNPKLTEPALQEIKEYFVSMRNTGNEEDKVKSIPISARQLEGLIRLSEASARTRLSNAVTKKDAKRAIDLLHHCLTLIGLDTKTNTFDIDRITTGITASQRGNIHEIKEIINALEKEIGKLIPVEHVVREAANKNISEEDVNEVIEKLKRAGDIFSPRHGHISKI